MNYLTPDFFDAWRAGGLRAFCYLEATMRYALARGDFVAAAELDFLTNVMYWRMAMEQIAVIREMVQQLRKMAVRDVLVA